MAHFHEDPCLASNPLEILVKLGGWEGRIKRELPQLHLHLARGLIHSKVLVQARFGRQLPANRKSSQMPLRPALPFSRGIAIGNPSATNLPLRYCIAKIP